MGFGIITARCVLASLLIIYITLLPQMSWPVSVDEVIIKVDDYYASGDIKDGSTYEALAELLKNIKGGSLSEKNDSKEALRLLIESIRGSSLSSDAADQLLQMLEEL